MHCQDVCPVALMQPARLLIATSPCTHSLCLVPIARFTPDAVSLAVFAWTWVSAAAPEWLVPLSSRVASAWCATVDRRLGLFSGSGGSSSEATIDGIRCHGHWLQYFSELWGSMSKAPGSTDRAVLHRLFGRLLGHSLADTEALSGHPAAAAARFQLLALALKYCRHSIARLQASICPVPVALLHDRVLKAALAW